MEPAAAADGVVVAVWQPRNWDSPEGVVSTVLKAPPEVRMRNPLRGQAGSREAGSFATPAPRADSV